MDRRELLKFLASAGVVSALSPDAFSMFRQVHVQIAGAPGLKTLNPHQDATVTTIVELIIPQTDTPGAKAVKVNEFIDLILTEWYDQTTTAHFLTGLSDVDMRSQKLFGHTFVDCAEAQQTQLLKVLDEEAFLARKNEALSKKVGHADALSSMSFFGTIKNLTLIGYYTSEAGFEEELHKSIIPAAHEGCAPIPARTT